MSAPLSFAMAAGYKTPACARMAALFEGFQNYDDAARYRDWLDEMIKPYRAT
jgi:hypothetical protein